MAGRSNGWQPVSTSEPPNWVEAFSAAAPTYDTVIPFFAYWGVVLARRARLEFGERVLDVGCGAGASLVPASMVTGAAVGVDPSLAMLRANPLTASVAAGDGMRLPFASGVFDVVLGGFVVQFLEDAKAGAAEMFRVLRAPGRLHLSLPEAEIPACGKVKQAWGQRLGLPPPPRKDLAWATEVVAAAGFEQVETSADEHTFTFASGAEYVAWCESHGNRAMFDAMNATDRAEYASDLATAAESAREGDTIPLRATARFVSAVRAG